MKWKIQQYMKNFGRENGRFRHGVGGEDDINMHLREISDEDGDEWKGSLSCLMASFGIGGVELS